MTSPRFVETPVGSLAVHDVGSGPPIVFWHSMFVDHRMFSRQFETLAETNRCIALDGPGHGASGAPRPGATMKGCALAALTVMDALSVDRAHFVGCAWGGHVGLHLASGHPERLQSLVFANAPIEPPSGSERRRVTLLSYAYRLLGPREFMKVALEQGLLDEAHRERLGPYVRECFTGSDRKGLYAAMHAFVVRRQSVADELRTVRIPTLFVTGENDTVWPPEIARRDTAHLENARLEVVPGAGHLTPLEAPELVTGLLSDFFAANSESEKRNISGRDT